MRAWLAPRPLYTCTDLHISVYDVESCQVRSVLPATCENPPSGGYQLPSALTLHCLAQPCNRIQEAGTPLPLHSVNAGSTTFPPLTRCRPHLGRGSGEAFWEGKPENQLAGCISLQGTSLHRLASATPRRHIITSPSFPQSPLHLYQNPSSPDHELIANPPYSLSSTEIGLPTTQRRKRTTPPATSTTS